MRKYFQHFLVRISSLISLMNTSTKVNENHKLSVPLKIRSLFFKGLNTDLGSRYDNTYSMLPIASNKTRSENYMKCSIIVAKEHHLAENLC